ncbi:MAG TPA: diguanylate cyclase, partial [Steroidobacteraceae bacterium]
MSTLVLVVTPDPASIVALTQSDSAADGQGLAIVYADRLLSATRRLKINDDIQAVVLDWDLPDCKGAECLHTLMEVAPHLPILVLGDDPRLRQQTNLIEHGAQDYLLKSCLDADTLLSMVLRAIARKAREGMLFGEKERAQVTLNSIGEAVLSTDRAWRITFLNPVAEKLIGWSLAEALGRPLSEVFAVIDATTRERIMPQLEDEVRHGRTALLPPNCVLLRRDAHELPIEDSAAPIHDRSGQVAGMVVVFHDVSASLAMVQKMAHLAEHDILTSLPNRALLDDRLEQGIALAKRYNRKLAVLFVDLDHFKHINDTLGHLIGDQLLKAVSQRITPCVRNSDTVSRQGGDEFIVLLTEVAHVEDAGLIAEKVRLAILEPYQIADHYLHLSTSIGVSVFPDDGADAETLI